MAAVSRRPLLYCCTAIYRFTAIVALDRQQATTLLYASAPLKLCTCAFPWRAAAFQDLDGTTLQPSVGLSARVTVPILGVENSPARVLVPSPGTVAQQATAAANNVRIQVSERLRNI